MAVLEILIRTALAKIRERLLFLPPGNIVRIRHSAGTALHATAAIGNLTPALSSLPVLILILRLALFEIALVLNLARRIDKNRQAMNRH